MRTIPTGVLAAFIMMSAPAAEPTREPDVPYVPTPDAVVSRMLAEARLTGEDLVYDLGCGDGRIVIEAAKKYGCQSVGFEIDPTIVKIARDEVAESELEHLVTIEQRDIFTVDLSEASVVTLYLLPELNLKLVPQLMKLKPGSRIISHEFGIWGIKADKVVLMKSGKDDYQHRIHVWTAPLKPEAMQESDDYQDPTGTPAPPPRVIRSGD